MDGKISVDRKRDNEVARGVNLLRVVYAGNSDGCGVRCDGEGSKLAAGIARSENQLIGQLK